MPALMEVAGCVVDSSRGRGQDCVFTVRLVVSRARSLFGMGVGRVWCYVLADLSICWWLGAPWMDGEWRMHYLSKVLCCELLNHELESY